MLQRINTERMYTYEKMLASMLAVLMLLVAVPQMCFADDADVSEEVIETTSPCDCVDEPEGDVM